MIWSDMLLVGNGKLTTSESKSSALWYILVTNLFSSIAICKSRKVSLWFSIHPTVSGIVGINTFRTYHKTIDVIHITIY